MKRRPAFYIFLGTLSLISICFFLLHGKDLVINYERAISIYTLMFLKNIRNPFCVLMLQIIIIITLARTFSFLLRKIGQPAVIGEIMAGIILGPSVLGAAFPQASSFVFPEASLSNIQFLSQIGLILFMFVIGMEINTDFGKKSYDALIISQVSIVIPFILGILLSLYIYNSYSIPSVPFIQFSLFIGISMSITALPVLVRIVHEKGLLNSKLGKLAITCATIDDILAWCILAFIVAISTSQNYGSSILTISLSFVYIIFMLKIVRPIVVKIQSAFGSNCADNISYLTIILSIAFISSYITEIIGIHALFGAFFTGIIMPKNQLTKDEFIKKVNTINLILFMPLYFAYTGLRTEFDLFSDGKYLLTCITVIILAVIGKLAGSAIPARLMGQSWKDALSIGILLNTRGLMELIVLNVGYDLGILRQEIFSIMLIMAVFTTVMTSPTLDLLNYINKSRESGTLSRYLH